jgi:hypothetical protein
VSWLSPLFQAGPLAHGLQGRADLPVPIVAFYWAAGIVLVISFGALALLWKRPLLDRVLGQRDRPAWGWLDGFGRSKALLLVARVVVLAAFLLVVAAALFGNVEVTSNIAPTLVFCTFFVGLVPLAVLTGDTWRAIAPWTTIALLAGAPRRRRSLGGGIWWALPGLLLFTWLELVYPTAAHIRLLGWLVLAYSVGTVLAMARCGIDDWLDHGESFAVFSRLMAALSPLHLRGGRLYRRIPGTGALHLRAEPGLVPFVTSMIATVSFDGLSRTPWWSSHAATASQRLIEAGAAAGLARNLVWTLGMASVLLVIWGLFELSAVAADALGDFAPRVRHGRVADALVHSLLPIALAYAIAHYFSFWVFQNQDLVRLASDPLGRGWDLFGTTGFRIDFNTVSPNAIWIVQVVAIVVGHVWGLVLAHDRALELAATPRGAALSQLPTLGLMVLLTVGGLFFLSGGMVG